MHDKILAATAAADETTQPKARGESPLNGLSARQPASTRESAKFHAYLEQMTPDKKRAVAAFLMRAQKASGEDHKSSEAARRIAAVINDWADDQEAELASLASLRGGQQ